MKQSILVVGGAGYIGCHMVKRLLANGHAVVTLDDLSSGHEELLPGGDFIRGDLGDTSLLNSIFRRHSIAAVMHFAAFALVGESVADPLRYYRNNVAKTTALLQSMVDNHIRHFIFSSSAAVYGEPDTVPIPEDHLKAPTNPYGNTKRIVEDLLVECDRAHGITSISLRYFNAAGADPSGTIGEKHDPETHLIPLVLKAALDASTPVKIFGNDYATSDGTAVRDYVHVNDLADAHLLALDALFKGHGTTAYNLGNSKGYSVKEVIEATRRVAQKPIHAVEAGRRPGDPAALVADSTKIRRELGWQPDFESLEAIIETAWRWHRRHCG